MERDENESQTNFITRNGTRTFAKKQFMQKVVKIKVIINAQGVIHKAL